MSQDCQTGRMLASTALNAQRNKMADQVEGVRSCTEAPIHDMRVASRRLRMALRIYRPYLSKGARKLVKREARGIGRALGRRRELDVMIAMLRDHREASEGIWRRFLDHILPLLASRQETEVRACNEALLRFEKPAFHEAFERIQERPDGCQPCILELSEDTLLDALELVRGMRKLWKRSGEAEDLHEVRIAIKQFRYACEFNRALYGAPMELYIQRLREVQGALGEWNECRLLEEMVLILGNAAPYDIAQGAPLVASHYGDRANVLEDAIAIQLKALFCKAGRKAFEALLLEGSSDCDCTPRA